MPDRPSSDACTVALDSFLQRQFVDWHGLPASCTLAAVTTLLPRLNDSVGRSRLGDDEALFTPLQGSGFHEPVRLWFRDEQPLVLDTSMLDRSPELLALLGALGEPPMSLDSRQGTMLITGGELVYPQRGLALFTSTSRERWTRVAVFASCTPEAYHAQFRLHLGTRRLPQRHR